jgi:hypothetical protein
VIPILFVALGAAAAAAAGSLAGRWAKKRSRDSATSAPPKEPSSRPSSGGPSETLSGMPADEPIALGDVLVLQGGLGRELWLVRRLELRESGGDPFLVLFEADGPASKRAIVAWEPARPELASVLAPQSLADVAMLAGKRSSRPPSTLDVAVDEASVTLQLEQRRVARGVITVAPPAPGREDGTGGPSALPAEGEALLIALYAGDDHGRAVIVRDDDGKVLAYVGRQLSLDAVSVLRNR